MRVTALIATLFVSASAGAQLPEVTDPLALQILEARDLWRCGAFAGQHNTLHRLEPLFVERGRETLAPMVEQLLAMDRMDQIGATNVQLTGGAVVFNDLQHLLRFATSNDLGFVIGGVYLQVHELAVGDVHGDWNADMELDVLMNRMKTNAPRLFNELQCGQRLSE